MGYESQLTSWTLLYAAELISFSLVLLFQIQTELRKPIIYWIISNILAALGMLMPSTFVETDSTSQASALSFLFSAISITITYWAVNYRRRTTRTEAAIFIFLFAAWAGAVAMPYGWFSALLTYCVGTAVVLMSVWAAYHNRIWRGLWGHTLLLLGFVACAALICWRGLVVYAHRDGAGFDVDPAISLLGMQLLVFTSFFLQIGFFSVVIGRRLRIQRLRERRMARAFAISQALSEEQREIDAVAEERLDMLSLLTHEVRQPINNAQAALEALDLEMSRAEPITGETRSAIARAQNVLDGITLSISNAILGVSLLDADHTLSTRPINALEIALLARSDCPADQRQRILLDQEQEALFVDLDPVLVRLAVRNLLDNALKYSPPETPVRLDIVADERRLGVSFLVTSELDRPSLLAGDIFAQGVRGGGSKVEGTGHGLFLVKKVADAHRGSITYELTPPSHVTFDLFLPD